MRKPLVVISGVTGMTGNETARQLLKQGATVLGFDNFFASTVESVRDLRALPDFIFHEYDLRNGAHMDRLDAEVRSLARDADSIAYVNCAAVVHTKHFYVPSATFDVNVVAMRDFLERAIAAGAQSFLNCSTSEVYSMRSFSEGGVRESDILGLTTAETSQRSSYAAGKLLTEFFTREAVEAGRIRGASIRFANVYSAEEEQPEHIIPFAIDSLLKGGEITLLENARETFRTFLHNHDSCSSVLALMRSEAALDGSVYNVGTDEEISILDLVHLIGRKLGRTDVRVRFEGRRTSDPPRRMLNTEKLRRATGWAPRVNLDEGLDACVAVRRRRSTEAPRG